MLCTGLSNALTALLFQMDPSVGHTGDYDVIIARLKYYPFFLMQVARLWSLTLSCLNLTTATAGGQPLCCTSSLEARSPAKHQAAKFQDLQFYSNDVLQDNCNTVPGRPRPS